MMPKLYLEDDTCDICGAKSEHVVASPLGPISYSSCSNCIRLYRLPYGILLGGLIGCERETVAEWAKVFINGTLKFYSKSEDELWGEVDKLTDEYYKESFPEFESTFDWLNDT